MTSMEYTDCQPVHDLITQLCQVRTASPGFDPHDYRNTNNQDNDTDATLLQELSLQTTCQILLDTALNHSTHTLEDASLLKHAVTASKKAGMDKKHCTLWERQITTLERTMADDMIQSDTQIALSDCGLQSILTALQHADANKAPLSLQAGLSHAQVEAALTEFYASLYAPPLPLYETWKDPVLRKYARSKVAHNVAQAYTTIYNAISSPDIGAYTDLSFLGHEPEQVKALLSL